MKIRQIFKKNIDRPINGVVKADQLEESVVWQELEEYVVTGELDGHIRKFLSSYLAALDKPGDPVLNSRNGIWVSGFFGSGKSHFIKILSYLLENRNAMNPETGEEKRALAFFEEKFKDAMLLGDLKRAARSDTETILFNIDSKADAAENKATLLSVFWRVLNEKQQFCSESLHLGEIERYLFKKGKLDAFKTRFREIYGSDWENERDAYSLIQDEIVEALSEVLGKSKQAANDWFEKSETEFNLSVENFARRVKEYLDVKPAGSRIVFLVDEIGQFIGGDTRLMLNLQTIVEDLGRLCGGRAWIIVTSQEDIDAVLGEFTSSKANDFSKIQGRFYTRLSLSSSNTDEVIQARLLRKNEPARAELESLFAEKGDILKNQLTFSYDTRTFKNFDSPDDFCDIYPFAPYHFALVQKIFESIRKAGATGLHLSRGERSMLDAFQSAAVNISGMETGALVPLHEFFPCIESFLDTAVKRSIDQARDNPGLEIPFDVKILQTLFLIRYVDIIKPNIDNLVTLCIDETDTDRIDLRKNIDAALERLEKQNLINKNGDLYFFLTNEEREVSREIKSIDIMSSDENKLLGDIIFDEVLGRMTKYKHAANKRDYPVNRVCDGKPFGKELNDEIGIEFISPLKNDYELFISAKCNIHSSDRNGHVIIKLPDDPKLVSEIRTFLQTQKYVKQKTDAAASNTLKKILRDRSEQNTERRTRLKELLETLIPGSDFFALGKPLEIKAETAVKAVEEAFDHLIANVFNKFDYLEHVYDDPLNEIKETLAINAVAQQQLTLELETGASRDIKEIKTYIELNIAQNHPVYLHETAAYFSRKPYGWNEYQTVVLVARIFMSGIIDLVNDIGRILPAEAYAILAKTQQWKTVRLIKRKIPSEKDIKNAQALGKELFGKHAPDGHDKLAGYIRDGLGGWIQFLEKYKPLADTGNYPGSREIGDCLELARQILKVRDSYELIKAFNTKRNELEDASEDLADLKDFYNNQKQTWETLCAAMQKFKVNRTALEKNPDTAKAIQKMDQILATPSPYAMLKDVNNLIASVQTVNDALVAEQCEKAVQEVDGKIQSLIGLLDENKAKDDFRNRMLSPLQGFKKKIESEYSIPQIDYYIKEAFETFDDKWVEIEEAFKPKPKPKPDPVSGKIEPVLIKKEVKTIQPSSYKHKGFLETEEDVDVYLDRLKAVLIDAIKNNKRIRIV